MGLLRKHRLRGSIATAHRFYTTIQSKTQQKPAVLGEPYWKHLSPWKEVEEKDFLTYGWQKTNTVERPDKLMSFLDQILPAKIIDNRQQRHKPITTRDAFLSDIEEGIKAAPMAVRLTPHILSVANWASPFDDPIIRQFVPLKSNIAPDHPELKLDSLDEVNNSPTSNLVHRYPDRVLFLATSVCPVYCAFCTRSYAIGAPTESVKKRSYIPARRRWDEALKYIDDNPNVNDVVVSGGDSFYLDPSQLMYIGQRLLQIPHVKRIRLASKGLAVCPMRLIDESDGWADCLIQLNREGREKGKELALHTHFNHPNEITWVTSLAARKLFRQGVTVRNQTVLLRGVNDSVAAMSRLIRELANLQITPYYVYQADMVKGVEDMRTPLSTILNLEEQIRCSIAGFMMPRFVVDLPGGGGKVPALSYKTYNRETGASTFRSPLAPDRVFMYHDPQEQVPGQDNS